APGTVKTVSYSNPDVSAIRFVRQPFFDIVYLAADSSLPVLYKSLTLLWSIRPKGFGILMEIGKKENPHHE
ncbi:MAG: hypothetical protein ACI4OI_05630, partial [Gemmiger sp.]